MEHKIISHKDLKIWKDSISLALDTYEFTKKFPPAEKYGLISQIRRSAVSVPSNIAEGKNRGTRNDYRHFLRIARGSLAEYETQIEISYQLGFIPSDVYEKTQDCITQIGKMINAIIKKLSISPNT